jgi:hypothetical protein
MVTKRQMLKKLIRPILETSLRQHYGLSAGNLTEKQNLFLDGLSDSLYDIFKAGMTVKSLTELNGGKNDD